MNNNKVIVSFLVFFYFLRLIYNMTVSKGLAQGPYVAARAGVEPTTLRLKVINLTNAPPRPTSYFQESSLTAMQPHRMPHRIIQATTSKRLVQGPNVAAREEFELATLQIQGNKLTTEPPRI